MARQEMSPFLVFWSSLLGQRTDRDQTVSVIPVRRPMDGRDISEERRGDRRGKRGRRSIGNLS